ncbi:uncharacterized protein LOC144448198 [Glandiceps talaboti]
MKYNRTVVKVPFISEDDNGQKMTTAWNKVFDEEKFNSLLASSSIETFQKACKQTVIQVAFWSNKNLDMYENTRQLYKQVFDIELPNIDGLPKNERESLRKVKPEVTCVAFYDPEGYADFESLEQFSKKLDDNLVTSPVINLMLDTFTKTVNKVCDSDMYLAMHWRNKTEQWCNENVEHSETCESVKDKVTEVTGMIATTVMDIMRESKTKCLYVAYPTGSEEVLRFLNERIQARRRIITADDIAVQYPDEMADMETRLLVEEHICLGADKFIGWPKSIWSRSVIQQREDVSKESLYFDTLPNLMIVTHDYHLVFDLVFS